jgi:hypothetical protein
MKQTARQTIRAMGILICLFTAQWVSSQILTTYTATPACHGNDGKLVVSAPWAASVHYNDLYRTYLNSPSHRFVRSQYSDTFSHLPFGDYLLYVTDSLTTDSLIVHVGSTVLDSIAIIPGLCPSSNGSATAIVTGISSHYNYYWNGSGLSSTNTFTTQVSRWATLYVKDSNGCSVRDTFYIPVQTTDSVYITQVGSICSSTKQLVATVVGGKAPYIYKWSPTSSTSTTNTVTTGTNSIYYQVSVTDSSGCMAVARYNYHYTTPNTRIIDSSGVVLVSPTCHNANGSISLTNLHGTAPFTFQWSTGDSTAILNNVGVGYYNVTVTDSNGCADYGQYYLNNGNLQASTSSQDPNCGMSNGLIYAFAYNGSGHYAYHWIHDSTNLTNIAGNLPAGSYTLIVTDSLLGCPDTLVTKLVGRANFRAHIIMPISCDTSAKSTFASGVVINSGTPPYQYLWSNGATTDTTTILAPYGYATFSLTVTDSMGCASTTYSSFYAGYQNYIDTTSYSVVNPTCHGGLGSITLNITNASGPLQYLWSTGDTTASITNLGPSQTIYVTVTDAQGCKSYGGTYTNNLSLTAYVSPVNPSCGHADGSIQVYVYGGSSGPVTYAWSPNTSYTGNSATHIPAGNYTIIVSDTGGCTDTLYVKLTSQAAFQLKYTPHIICNGGKDSVTVSVTGIGTPPYTYLWSGSQITNTIPVTNNGNYNVTVTDSNGCSMTSTYHHVKSSVRLIDSNTTTIVNGTCATNGSITIYPRYGTAPYNYTWANGNTTSSITNLTTGNYYVTVGDATGCRTTWSYRVSSTKKPILYLSVTNPSCGSSNGKISTSVNSGTKPYTYNWSPNTSNHASSTSNLAGGQYSVTVTDSLGCTATATATITPQASFTGSFINTPTACDSSLPIGTSTVIVADSNPSNLHPPFQYHWLSNTGHYVNGVYVYDTISTSQIATGLAAGIYPWVLVKDSLGCQRTLYSNTSIVKDPSCYNHITGNIYIDANNNCMLDSGEQGLLYGYVSAKGAGHTYWASSDSLGNYDVSVLQGTYVLKSYRDYYNHCFNTSCAHTDTVTFASISQTSSGHNFASGYAAIDLSISANSTRAVPSRRVKFTAYYDNRGSIASPATVTWVYPDSLTLDSSNIVYTSHSPATRTITFSIASVAHSYYSWTNKIQLWFKVADSAVLNSNLISHISISPLTGDCDTSNNSQILTTLVGRSFDPNDKEVSPSGNLSASDSVLTYTIRFQNTGTAPASYVQLRDSLSALIDPASVQLGACSAPCVMNLSGNGILTFTFYDINLPDSSTNEPASHGYVTYTVHTIPNLAIGSMVKNRASIYFDLNAPVATNTTVSLRSNVTGIPTLSASSDMRVSVVPNPVQDQAAISFDDAVGVITFNLIDINGAQVAQYHTSAHTLTLDATALASGLYLFTAVDASGHRATGKISILK